MFSGETEKMFIRAREVLAQNCFHFDKAKFIKIMAPILIYHSDPSLEVRIRVHYFISTEPEIAVALLATTNDLFLSNLSNVTMDNVAKAKHFMEHFGGIFNLNMLMDIMGEILVRGYQPDVSEKIKNGCYKLILEMVKEAFLHSHYEEILEQAEYIKKMYLYWVSGVAENFVEPTSSSTNELPPIEKLDPSL